MISESRTRTDAADEGSAARVVAWLVLGAAAVAALVAIFLIPEALEDQSKAIQLAATAPASVVFGWSIWRMPRWRSSHERVERAVNRRGRGNIVAAAYPDRTWRQLETGRAAPPLTASTHAAAAGMPAAMALGYGVMAIFAARLAGQEDRFGDMTELGIFGFCSFGLLVAAAVRSLVRVATRQTALRVEGDAVVLGVALGYIPPVRIDRQNVLAVTGSGDSIDLLSGGRRVDRLALRVFEDPDAVASSLGLRHGVRRKVESSASAPAVAETTHQAGQLSLLDLPPAGAGSAPDDGDLAGARLQWRARLGLTVVLALVLTIGFVASVMWWADQRGANASLLDEGEPVVAEVVDVDSGRNSSIVVRFEIDGEPLERTVHAGLFRGYPRGLLGEEVTILVDPSDPRLVRSPDSRNMHPLTWVSAMVTLVFGGIAVAGVRSSRAGLGMLDGSSWQLGRLSADRRGLRQSTRNVVLETPAGVPVAQAPRAVGLDDETWFKHPGLVTFRGRSALIVLEGRRRAVMIPVKGRVSRR